MEIYHFLIYNTFPPGTVATNNIDRDVNTHKPIQGVIARAYIADTLFQAGTTGTDGVFTFTNLPQNKDLKVETGGLNDYYAFANILESYF